MYWSLLIATCLVALVSAAPDNTRMSFRDVEVKFRWFEHIEEEWQTFKINYNRAYKDAKEETLRKRIFTKHLAEIEAHNRLYSKGLKTFTMGINRFSDLENSEFVKLMNGYKPGKPSEESRSASPFKPEFSSLPDDVDWRQKGYVTPVKDQRQCGSCWAFSATGTLEGQHFRASGSLVSLSEQQLVDCSKENDGCDGGNPSRALSYIAKNGGIDKEDSYKYEAKDGPCRYNPSAVGATCTGYVNVAQSESALEEAVATIGPISVCIDAALPSFQNYKSGVYDEPACSSSFEDLDHAVLVVGYGKTSDGVEYWIVKNSWGTGWGMDGYIWMSRNKGNQCGIADAAVYPTV